MLELYDIVALLLLWGADGNQILANGISAVHVAAFQSRRSEAAAAAALGDPKVMDSFAEDKSFPSGHLFQLFCDSRLRQRVVDKLGSSHDGGDSSTGPKDNAGHTVVSKVLQSRNGSEDAQPAFVEQRWGTLPLTVRGQLLVKSFNVLPIWQGIDCVSGDS